MTFLMELPGLWYESQVVGSRACEASKSAAVHMRFSGGFLGHSAT